MKQTNLKGYMSHDTNYMTFWKKQNYRDNLKGRGFQGLVGREKWTGRAQKDFEGTDTTLYETKMADTFG